MEPSDGITYSNHYEQSILDERIKKKIHTRKKRQWSKKDKRKKLAKKGKKKTNLHTKDKIKSGIAIKTTTKAKRRQQTQIY